MRGLQSRGVIMKRDDLEIYQRALAIGEIVWRLVGTWPYLARDTSGKQLIRSADSIAANISEGYGRHHRAERRQFCFYARGSLFETETWLEKAARRQLIDETTHRDLQRDLKQLCYKLNRFIARLN